MSGEIAVRRTIDELKTAMAALPTHRHLSSASGSELLELTQVVATAVKRLEGLGVFCAGTLDRKMTSPRGDEELQEKVGFASPVELVRDITGSSLHAARHRLRLASEVTPSGIANMPDTFSVAPFELVAAALEKGLLAEQSAQQIVTTVLKFAAAPNTLSHEMEAHLMAEVLRIPVSQEADCDSKRSQILDRISKHGVADESADLPVGMHLEDVRKACRDAARQWQQEAPVSADKFVSAERYVSLGIEKEGLVPLTGRLLPEVAATLDALINAVTSPRVAENDPAFSSAVSGNEARNKRHDALATILNVASRSADLPSLGGAPITVMIQTSVEDLEWRKTGVVHSNQGPVGVSNVAVLHAACSGSVQFFAADRAGKLVSLGNQQRAFTAHQRRAILARDGGCVIPGCNVPGAWCEVHHVTPHALGGPTHTDNGVLLCYYHHRHIESSGWNVRMRDGVPEVRAPQWKDRTQEWFSISKNDPPDIFLRPRWAYPAVEELASA